MIFLLHSVTIFGALTCVLSCGVFGLLINVKINRIEKVEDQMRKNSKT